MNEIINSSRRKREYKSSRAKLISKEIGQRIKMAREAIGLTRQQVADTIQDHSGEPFSIDVLKQWELGQNRIRVDLIPLLCEILHIDTGYLFGEYPQFTRQLCDVQTATGLSKNVAARLIGRSYCDGDSEWPDGVPKDTIILTEESESLNILFETSSFTKLLARARECRQLWRFPTVAESVSQAMDYILPYIAPKTQQSTAQKVNLDSEELSDYFKRISRKQKSFFDDLAEESKREKRDMAIFNFQRAATQVAEELIELREVELNAEEI